MEEGSKRSHNILFENIISPAPKFTPKISRRGRKIQLALQLEADEEYKREFPSMDIQNWIEREQEIEKNQKLSIRIYQYIAYYFASYGRNSSIHGLSHISHNYFSSNFLSRILFAMEIIIKNGAIGYLEI